MMKTNTPTIVLMTILVGAPAFAAVNVLTNSDGTQYTSVLLNGSSTEKYDIVVLGDGFTAGEQGDFNNAVSSIAAYEDGRPAGHINTDTTLYLERPPEVFILSSVLG